MKKRAFIIIIFFFIFIVMVRYDMYYQYNNLTPQIQHGEFPFELKYEFNGEIYEINDTVICDFDGFDITGGFCKYRMWKESLKSENGRLTIILDENVPSVLEPERINERSELYFNYGEGEYYMDDCKSCNPAYVGPHFFYVERYQKTPKVTYNDLTPLTEDQLQKYFGIKIIDWKFSKPIKNIFL